MLTEKQQNIICDLTNEFMKINKPAPTKSGGLINKALIDKKIDDSLKQEAELDLVTKATKAYVDDMMQTDVDRLNEDLVPMGMKAKIKEHYMYIHELRSDGSLGTLLMYFNYKMANHSQYLPDGRIYTVYTRFKSISYSGCSFNNIDDLCKSDSFINKIEDNYKWILSKNKNK